MPPASHSPEHFVTGIRSALLDQFIRIEGASVANVSITNIVRRLYSTVFFLTVELNNRTLRLVAKTTVHHSDNKAITEHENQAVLEFNILRRLYSKYQEIVGCSACRPVLVIPALETVVIEFVEGSLLGDELGRARYLSSRAGFAKLKSYFSQCGNWLRHFQDLPGPRTTSPNIVDGILKRCDFRLRLIEEAHDQRCPNDLRDRVMRRLQEQRANLDGEQILVAGRHGDFGPWNVLCGPAGITVLDFFGYQEEPIAVDPLQMLMALERERQCLAASPKRIEGLKHSFSEWYGHLADKHPPLLYIFETLHRICTVQGCLTNRTGLLHKRIERSRCIKSNLQWLVCERPLISLWPNGKELSVAPGL